MVCKLHYTLPSKREFGQSVLIQRGKTVYSTTHKTAINRPMDHIGETLTHILCKVSSFLLKAFHFRGYNTETIGFPPYKSPGGGEGYCHNKYGLKSIVLLWLLMGYIDMCRCEGYGFQAVYSGIGYINQRVWV